MKIHFFVNFWYERDSLRVFLVSQIGLWNFSEFTACIDFSPTLGKYISQKIDFWKKFPYNVSFVEGDFGPRHKRTLNIENPCLQLPNAIKRSIELIAAGFFTTRSCGIRDPVLPDAPKIHLKCMTKKQMDEAMAACQTMIRLFGMDQARLVFGLNKKKDITKLDQYDVADAPNDDALLLQQSSINGFVFEPSVPMGNIIHE